jgi:hypothetical protein
MIWIGIVALVYINVMYFGMYLAFAKETGSNPDDTTRNAN